MIRCIFVCSIIFSWCSGLYADWQSIGPYGTNLRTMARSNTDENIIYATSYSNPTLIFKSIDGGDSWINISEVQYWIHSLGIDPTDHDNIYAGADGIIYKSTDGGMNWSSHTASGIGISGVSVNPTSPNILYGACMTTGSNFSMGFLKSTDSGETWTCTPLNSYMGQAYCLAIDPQYANIIYIGGYYSNSGDCVSVYKSTDGGVTFNEISSGFADTCSSVYSVAVHPTNSNIVWAGTRGGGIYRTTNSGGSWNLVSADTFYNIYSLAVSTINPNIVFAGADTRVYKSTDAGSSWFISSTGLSGWSFYGLEISPTNPSILCTANNAGVFKTTDCGSSWFISSTGINLTRMTDCVVAPSSPSVIYVEREDVGVYKTTNGGTDWTLLPIFLDCGNVCALAVHNTDPNTVFSLEGSG